MADMRPPSEKQYDYAKAIADELEIPLPEIFSMSSYSDFISHYKKQYKLELQRYHDEEEEDGDY